MQERSHDYPKFTDEMVTESDDENEDIHEIFSDEEPSPDDEKDFHIKKRKAPTDTNQLVKSRLFKRLRKNGQYYTPENSDVLSDDNDCLLESSKTALIDDGNKGKEKETHLEEIVLIDKHNNLYEFNITSYEGDEGELKSYQNAQLGYNESFRTRNQFLDHVKHTLGLTNNQERTHETMELRQHQKAAIRSLLDFFGEEENSRASIIMACGTGKTFTGLKAIETLKSNVVLIIVPTLALMKQTKKYYQKNLSIQFDYLCVCSDQTIDRKNVCTEPGEISKFIQSRDKHKLKIVFSTYQSLNKINEVFIPSKKKKITFDLVICDEAHHVIEKNNYKYLNENIISKKWLFMTATLPGFNVFDKKISKTKRKIYGDVIYSLSCREAIDQGVISDFKIVLSGIRDPELHSQISNKMAASYNKPGDVIVQETTTAISSHLALEEVMQKLKLKYAFSFHSRVRSSFKFAKTHDLYTVDDNTKAHSSHIDGKMSSKIRSNRLKKFKAAEKGIICSAKALSEGVNVPEADTVIFVDPCSSQLKVIQSVGRALRKSPGEDKETHIIIPVHYKSNERIDISKYKKLLNTLTSLYLGNSKKIRHSKRKKKENTSYIDDQAGTDKDEVELCDMLQIEGFSEKAKDSLYIDIFNMISTDMKVPSITEPVHEFRDTLLDDELRIYKLMTSFAKKDRVRTFSYYSDSLVAADSIYRKLWHQISFLLPSKREILHEYHWITRFDHDSHMVYDSDIIYQLFSFIHYYDRLPELDEKFCNLNYIEAFFIRCQYFNGNFFSDSNIFYYLKRYDSLMALTKEDIDLLIPFIHKLCSFHKEILEQTILTMANSRNDIAKYVFDTFEKFEFNDLIYIKEENWNVNYSLVREHIERYKCLPSEFSTKGKWIRDQLKYQDNLSPFEKDMINKLNIFLLKNIKKQHEKKSADKRELRKIIQGQRFCFFQMSNAKHRETLSALKNFNYLIDTKEFSSITESIVVGPAPNVPGNGYGAFAIKDILAGTKLGRYNGQYIITSNYDNDGDFYHWQLSDKTSITAIYWGNWSRFMNHSDTPNVVAKEITINNTRRVVEFEAAINITIGQQLLVNYGELYWDALNITYEPIVITPDDGIDVSNIPYCSL